MPYVGYFSNFYALLSDEAFLAQEFSKTAYIFYISLVFSLRNTISPRRLLSDRVCHRADAAALGTALLAPVRRD